MKRQTTMKAGFVRVDDEILERIKKDFAANGRARVHVGVLGGFDARQAITDTEGAEPISNAALGAVHEFGVIGQNIPARSFLRMPVITQLPAALLATDRTLWHRVLIKDGIKGALALLGAYALDVIHLAFETGGFGLWQALKPRTIRRKGSSAILIDTAQLRQAITAELSEGKTS